MKYGTQWNARLRENSDQPSTSPSQLHFLIFKKDVPADYIRVWRWSSSQGRGSARASFFF